MSLRGLRFRGANRRELCRRFGISPQVGYKRLARFAAGDSALADRSRRPHESPGRIAASSEALALAVRDAHPAWGARKIACDSQGENPTTNRLRMGGCSPPAAKLWTSRRRLVTSAESGRRQSRSLSRHRSCESPDACWVERTRAFEDAVTRRR